MNQLCAFTLLATLPCAHAWVSTSNIHSRTSALFSSPDPANPCWQDNYDSEDDCLSTTYSAAFVAEEWIKSMPCGKVRFLIYLIQIAYNSFISTSFITILQDADCLPENLSHPGVMGDAGVEKVNVMEYLNLKRAAPVAKQCDKSP